MERSMSSLSGKLVGIVLNAFNYGNHLGNINGQVSIVDEELGYRNFKHVRKHLCELWNRDLIYKYWSLTYNKSKFCKKEKSFVNFFIIQKEKYQHLPFYSVKAKVLFLLN